MRNKKALIGIAALVVAAVVGATLAINWEKIDFDNLFQLSTYKTEVTEHFDSPDDWKPCDDTPKQVVIKNPGTAPIKVRIKMAESWIDKDGGELGLSQGNTRLAVINYGDLTDWELGSDGHYYYKGTLAAGASATFMESVSFNCDANVASTKGCVDDGTSTECNLGSDSPYEHATYHLALTIQTVQEKDGESISWEDVFPEPKKYATFASGFMTNLFRDAIPGDEETVTAFKRSSEAPVANVTTTVVSSDDSPYEILGWYDNGTDYWYSVADYVTVTDSSISNWFYGWYSLADISGMMDFDMSHVTNMNSLFSSGFPFDLTSLHGLENWDVSNVTNFSSFAYSNNRITDWSALSDWNMSGATNVNSMFYGTAIQNVDFLNKWRLVNVQQAATMFGNTTNLTNIGGLRDWVWPKLAYAYGMFNGAQSLSDLSPIAGWDVSNVSEFSYMFYDIGATDASALNGWQLKCASNRGSIFSSNTTVVPAWATSRDGCI